MTDPFDDLERQLRGRVRERAATAPARTRRRRGIGRTPLIAIAALGLTATGAAVAASTLHFSKSDREQGNAIALAATNASYHQVACKPIPGDIPSDRPTDAAHLKYADGTVLPAFASALPWLTKPTTPAEQARIARLLKTEPAALGTVLRGTLHVVTPQRGKEVLVYVQSGGFWKSGDPARCLQIRQASVKRLAAGHSAAALQWALSSINSNPEVDPSAQSLAMVTSFACSGGPSCGWGGGGTNLVDDKTSPRARLKLGIQGWNSSNGHPDRYYGLAGPTATRILVHPQHASKLGPVPRYAVVRRNLWVLDLPKNTGPVQLTEVDKVGTVLRRMTIRNIRAQQCAKLPAGASERCVIPTPRP